MRQGTISSSSFQRGRNQYVELLRVVSAFAIVWFHSKAPGNEVAYSGLSVFLMLTMLFEVGENWNRQVSASGLARRLLLPWLYWTVFYGAVNVARGKPLINVDYKGGIVSGILAGPSIHLWYLPFVFCLVLLVGYGKKALSQRAFFYLSSTVVFLTLSTTYLWEPWSRSVGYPVAQWAQAVTPVAIGLLIGTRQASRLGRIALAATILGLSYVWLRVPLAGVALPHLMAILLVLAALHLGRKVPLSLDLQMLAGATFGIYLSHPFFLSALKFLSLPYVVWVGLAFLLSGIATVTYQKLRPKANEAIAFVRLP